jgi:hypothetical protein
MAKVIEFYIPAGFRKVEKSGIRERGRVKSF